VHPPNTIFKECEDWVRFQVLTVVGLKMTVFWDIVLCSLVEVYRCFRGVCCLQHNPDDEGSKHLWNIGKLLPN
jgi:hypothetical protein